jgi:hypothetical protein
MADRHTLPRELEQLAIETGCGAQVVQDLYQGQFELLQRDARVRVYIPVLAMKRVRDVLRLNERRASVLRA